MKKKQPSAELPLARRRRRRWFTMLDLMLLPGLVYLIINNYIPMGGLFIAFKKIDYSLGIFKSPWVGLRNFRFLFGTEDAYIITRNTILYHIVFIILLNALGVAVGIMLSEVRRQQITKFFQTTILLPQRFPSLMPTLFLPFQ